MVQHFMFGPGWEEGCQSCSFMADHTDGMQVHLAARDVTFIAISRAPLAEIERFRRRMGWKFKWVSSFNSDFNHDFHVSFTEQDQGKVRAKPELFAEHYNQARLFYESQSKVEQAHIVAAFRFELSKVTVPAIRTRISASVQG